MHHRTKLKLAWTVIAEGIVAVLLGVVALRAGTMSYSSQSNTQASAAWVDAQVVVPPPVETYYPPAPTPEPVLPTTTPTPYPPPSAPTVYPPDSMNRPNIVWAAHTNNTVTIWLGRFSESPQPSIQDARPVVKWAVTLNRAREFLEFRVSPDRQSLAVLLYETCYGIYEPPPTPEPGRAVLPYSGECIGDMPEDIYVVNLLTNKVQDIPDYNSHYKLYYEYSTQDLFEVQGMLGWFDNSRVGFQNIEGQILIATKDGSSLVPKLFPGRPDNIHLEGTSLLPDGKTIFTSTPDAFYLRDADSGKVTRIGDRNKALSYDFLSLSPDRRSVSYLLRARTAQGGYDYPFRYSLWRQDLATGKQDLITGNGIWDPHPAWSPDASQIAFAHADSQPNNDYTDISQPEGADTNIYIADTTGTFTSRRLTSFTGTHNSDIQWTPEGNLVLSSTAGSKTGTPGIVAVSTKDGSATMLVSPAPGESLVKPLMFGPTLPRVGADPGP